MVCIQTASRLHFGLLSLASPGTLWPDATGKLAVPARRFGGVGLMVERPGIRLRVELADEWSSTGPMADRALIFGRRFAESASNADGVGSPCRIVVEEASSEHTGLGMGTQLGLAVGRSLAMLWGREMSVGEIARCVGRGERSALGVHGFEQGGFLVEAGQGSAGTLAPLVARVPFPPDWRIVLARPPAATGTHGSEERSAMARLTAPVSAADALCRLVLLGMLPALAERNLNAFGEALFDFNARAGEAFVPFQGGIYASHAVAGLVTFLRSRGVRGVGQSSWGPTVFAIVGSEDEGQEVARMLRPRLGDASEVCVTQAANHGATLSTATRS